MTATLTEIRTALATQLAAQISGLRTSADRNAQINPPTAIVVPSPGILTRYGETVDGAARYLLEIKLYVSAANSASGQDLADAYIATSGSKSIYLAVEADSTLGDVVDFAAVVEASGYGLEEVGGVAYLKVSFVVEVAV